MNSLFQLNLMRTSLNSIWQSYFALISHVKNNFQQNHLSTKQQKRVFRSLRESKMNDNRRININSKSNIQIIDDFFWKDHTKDMNEHMIVFYVLNLHYLLNRQWTWFDLTEETFSFWNEAFKWSSFVDYKWSCLLCFRRIREILLMLRWM